jgi:hypothetical protein
LHFESGDYTFPKREALEALESVKLLNLIDEGDIEPS